MTISSQSTKVVADGNGSQTVFDYNFYIPTSASVLVVYTDADGVETTLTTSQYSISGVGSKSGGTVTYPLVGSPIATGTTLTIARNLPYTQLISISNQGAFYPASVESALDNNTMLTQQLYDLFSRSIVAPISDPEALLYLPTVAQRANQILGFDADGNPIAASPSSALVSSAMQPVVAAATLALARTALGLGAMATEGIGAGLFDNSGDVTVQFQTSDISASQDITATDHLTQFNATGPITLTLARANTYFNGFGFWVNAFVDDVTVAIDANDAFRGQASGVSLVIPVQWRAFIYTDAASSGSWYVDLVQYQQLPIVAPNPGWHQAGGRLTLTSGAPVLTSNVTGATTIYYTPYLSNVAMLWSGETWYTISYGELSQALSDTSKSPGAAASNSIYDMFLWNDNGTIRCTRGPAWSSSTSRGTGAGTTELTRSIDGTDYGCFTNAYDITNGPGANRGVYVGTIATDASTQLNMMFNPNATAGGTANRLDVWNMNNRVNFFSVSRDNTDSWNYTTSVWRSADNSNNNRVTMVVGLNEDSFSARYTVVASNAGIVLVYSGVGFDTTSSPSATCVSTPNSSRVSMTATYDGYPGIGLHYYQAIEYSTASGTTTWYGDDGGSILPMNLTVTGRM